MTDTKQKEVWKTYTKYPFIEASNFGRVRTRDRYVRNGRGRSKRLVKGRILKQRLQKNGYLYVSFSVNGKTVCLRVHRVIASCFIPNPNNLPEINHIDCDKTNNSVSNLEWCTHEYNDWYREKYGTALKRPVFAVNLKTLEILHFESQSEAARKLRIHVDNINAVIKGRRKQIGGYLFVENKSEITKEKIKEIRNHMIFRGGVIVVNLETKEVLHFESQKEAARQLRISSGNICDVLKGRQKKTHGYWFCYADEKVIKNIKAKFGCEVANVVEGLMNKNHD